MGTFAQAISHKSDEDKYKAPKVILVPPDAFANEWAERPLENVEIGLRIVPDDDLQTARDNAAALTARRYPERYSTQEASDCFNDALLRHRIARSTCQPDDVRKPYFQAAEDTVRFALSTEGVKAISFEIETFELENSPLFTPATNDELADLIELLGDDDPFVGMDEAEERGTRRLLAVALDRIGGARARACADTTEA